MKKPDLIPLPDYREYPLEEMQKRSVEFCQEMQRRRTVRNFSDRMVPIGIIENCIHAAVTAPNGANMQPWHFVVVSDLKIKFEIRQAAEKEEHAFYERNASEEWGLDDHQDLGHCMSDEFQCS